MGTRSYEVRECQNPGCGLRYPLMEDAAFGERCPSCLGRTIAVRRKVILGGEVISSKRSSTSTRMYVLLDNVRSAWNVGSIVRSADAFGYQHVYLCGITRAANDKDVAKTSLGAQHTVPWSHHNNAVKLLRQLKRRVIEIWALENEPGSVSIEEKRRHVAGAAEIVLVVGNEITGVDPGILEIADQILSLPMRGSKRSFNVSVAFALAAHALQNPQVVESAADTC